MSAAMGLLAVVAALALSGCGSKHESATTTTQTPAAWADDLCGSLTTWWDSIRTTAQKLSEAQVRSGSLETAKNEVKAANQKLADDVDALGEPPTPGASKAKASVDDLSSQLKTQADKIDQAVSGISSARDVLTAASTVSAAFSTMGSDLSKTETELRSVKDDQWKQAFEQSKACRTLTNR